MNDTPFAPFQLAGPTPTTMPAEPAKRTRGSRRAAATTEPKKERKKRGPNKVKTATRGEAKISTKLDLKTALAIGSILKEEDRNLFSLIVGALNGASKASRARVLEAIGEMFE